MNRRFFWNVPEQELRAGFRGGEPAPGKDASFSGKPRNPDESLHAHAPNLVANASFFKATLKSQTRIQINANATSINPNIPTAMIVLVVVSN
ncbi:hypothetical protein [Mesorhizobium sp. L-8-10]|uniref:hypothetical protein n=1 Tax=Mesorhizobium sp. L-8-10 TaxID=2744523 RepID=UPI0019252A6A|nr:hypothetical protein [Mesorhizobium sp. L-8-10]